MVATLVLLLLTVSMAASAQHALALAPASRPSHLKRSLFWLQSPQLKKSLVAGSVVPELLSEREAEDPAGARRGTFWSKRAADTDRGSFWSKRGDSRGSFWSKRSEGGNVPRLPFSSIVRLLIVNQNLHTNADKDDKCYSVLFCIHYMYVLNIFLRRYHKDEKRSGAGGPPIPFSSIVR